MVRPTTSGSPPRRDRQRSCRVGIITIDVARRAIQVGVQHVRGRSIAIVVNPVAADFRIAREGRWIRIVTVDVARRAIQVGVQDVGSGDIAIVVNPVAADFRIAWEGRRIRIVAVDVAGGSV